MLPSHNKAVTSLHVCHCGTQESGFKAQEPGLADPLMVSALAAGVRVVPSPVVPEVYVFLSVVAIAV